MQGAPDDAADVVFAQDGRIKLMGVGHPVSLTQT
jgi:hypothetical protein